MRSFLAFLLLVVSVPCFSQVVLSMPEYNVVYRGYNNLIEVATTNRMKQKLIGLSCNGAQLIHQEQNKWSVVTQTENDTIEITMLHLKTGKLIDRFVFKVKDLPDPALFLGATESGGKISKLETRLFTRYDNSPLKAEFSVKGGALMIEGDPRVFEFEGNKLGEDYLEHVKTVSSGTKVTINAWVIGPDRKERLIAGEYIL